MRPERVFGWLLAATVAGFTAGWLARPLETFHTWATELGWIVAPALAGVAALYASRRPGEERTRRAWTFLGIGVLAWAAGEAYWAWNVLSGGGELPYPSIADIGWVLSLPFLTAGVLSWPRRRRIRRVDVLDGLVGVFAAALICFEFALEPILMRPQRDLGTWVSVAYPVAETIVIAPLLIGVLLNVWADRGRILLVGAGLIALASADAAFAVAMNISSEWSTLYDPVWVLAFVAVGAAAILPRGYGSGRFKRIPPGAYIATVTAGLTAVTVADAVESPEEAAVGWFASYAIAVMLVVGITRLLALARTRDRATAELRRAKSALQRAQSVRDRFMVQLVNAQERDSHKVADLLHDEVVQQLTALQFRLELQAQKLDEPALRDLAADSSDIIASIRRLLVELHPQILNSQGLAPAVDVAADALRDRGIQVHVTPFPHRLSREREVLAYRLVQEALTNVMKHSRAGSAEVEFTLEDGALRGRVADTGSGIRDAVNGDGLGLMLARERVELAGGRFTVRSNGGSGTEVLFELPAERTEEEVAA